MHAAILAGLLILGETAKDPLGLRFVGSVAGLSILIGYLIFRGYTLPDTVNAETVAVPPAPSVPAGATGKRRRVHGTGLHDGEDAP